MVNPAAYIRQVRQEASRISWPSKKEMMASTVMVLVMVAVAMLFFLVVDGMASWGVRKIIEIGA